MKCSSRRNCSLPRTSGRLHRRGLNEVQFPEELQPEVPGRPPPVPPRLNEVQFPEELQPPVQYGPDLLASEEAPRALRPEDQGERSQGR